MALVILSGSDAVSPNFFFRSVILKTHDFFKWKHVF